MQIRVYYEDTDAGGIVYHANYFKFCERLRSELFMKNHVKLFGENEGFVVRRIYEAEFIKPAFLGDLLEVKVKLLSHKKTSFEVLHEIYKGCELIFSTKMLIVYLKNSKPCKFPDESLEFLLSLRTA